MISVPRSRVTTRRLCNRNVAPLHRKLYSCCDGDQPDHFEVSPHLSHRVSLESRVHTVSRAASSDNGTPCSAVPLRLRQQPWSVRLHDRFALTAMGDTPECPNSTRSFASTSRSDLRPDQPFSCNLVLARQIRFCSATCKPHRQTRRMFPACCWAHLCVLSILRITARLTK